MFVKIPNQSVDISIELFERESPLACRFLQQQLANGAWQESALKVTDMALLLGPARPQALKLAKSRPQKVRGKGLVAYKSDTELAINWSGTSTAMGPVVGKLTPRSEANIEASLRPAKRVAEDNGARLPARKASTRPYTEPSAQLRAVMEMRARLDSGQYKLIE